MYQDNLSTCYKVTYHHIPWLKLDWKESKNMLQKNHFSSGSSINHKYPQHSIAKKLDATRFKPSTTSWSLTMTDLRVFDSPGSCYFQEHVPRFFLSLCCGVPNSWLKLPDWKESEKILNKLQGFSPSPRFERTTNILKSTSDWWTTNIVNSMSEMEVKARYLTSYRNSFQIRDLKGPQTLSIPCLRLKRKPYT